MTRDYGRPLQFGIFPSPDADSVEEIFTMAGIADREGLDFVLRVPYLAFPCRPVCPHEVEARVRLVERTGPAGRALLSTALTRFWVGR